MNEARRKLGRITTSVALRLRLQRVLDGATTAGIVFLLAGSVLLFAVKARLISPGQLAVGLLGAALVPLLAAVIQAARPLSPFAAAQRIDRSHDLHDRVSTAQEFSRAEAPSDWMRAQVNEALAHLEAVSPRRAAPLRRPRDLHVLGLLALCFALTALLRFPEPRPPARPAPPVLATISVDPEQLEAQRSMAAELAQRAKDLSNPEVQRLADELNRLLKELEDKKLTRKELFAKLAELENKYMDGLEGNFDDLLKQLKKMGGELQKEKLTEELGRALDQAELAQAKRAAHKLAERKQPLKDAERQSAARALQRAARNQLTPPKLIKSQIAKTERDIRRLKRELARRNDAATQRRLKRQQRQLERLNRQQQRFAEQKRQLERLNQQLDRAAADLLNKLSAQERETLRKLAEQLGKFADQIDSMRAMKKAQLSLRDLKEMLRRMGQGGKMRLAKLQDFNRRAGGKQGQDGKGGKGGKGGQQMFVLGPGGQPIPVPGAGSGQQQGQQQQSGQQQGDGIGDGTDPNVMQNPTRIAARHKNVLVKGEDDKGPTRSEIILGAAEDGGFSSSAYRRMYRKYEEIVEEVLKQEEVPLGYKHYVKQYFWLIKPR